MSVSVIITTHLKMRAGKIRMYNTYCKHQILSNVTAMNVFKQGHKPDTWRNNHCEK
jgi:hypothetical protein